MRRELAIGLLAGIGVLLLQPKSVPWPNWLAELAAEVPTGSADRDAFLRYLLRWIAGESGGNPCSQGKSQEAGIFQIDFDNRAKYGTTYAQEREGCEGSRLVQLLSPEQRRRRVAAGVAMVREAIGIAVRVTTGHGLAWPAADLWTLAKLYHNLPVLVRSWLPLAAQRGHASSWDDFASWVRSVPDVAAAMAIDRQAGYDPAKRQGAAPYWPLGRLLANAERVGRG